MFIVHRSTSTPFYFKRDMHEMNLQINIILLQEVKKISAALTINSNTVPVPVYKLFVVSPPGGGKLPKVVRGNGDVVYVVVVVMLGEILSVE